MPRTALPSRRPNQTRDVRLGESTFTVCVGFDEAGAAREVFANGPREGSDMQAVVSDACVLISIALQHGITPGELGHSLGRVPRWHGGQAAEGPASIVGLLVEAIGEAGAWSPYLLPDGNVQIAFSGGRTSAYMLHAILDANGGLRDDVVVSFQNTGREMPQTLDFVQEVGARWGVPIVWLEYVGGPPVGFAVVSHNSASRDSRPFEDLIRRKQALPNQQQRFCTAELKTLTAKRYCRALRWKRWTSVIGFRADEAHRIAREDVRYTTWTPLRDAGVTKQTVALFWRAQPFGLRLPVVRGKTVGGNCVDCFLKSEAYLAGYTRDHPEDDWSERMEARTGYAFSKRYTRAELRRDVQRKGQGLFSTEGALCQANDGECFG